MAKHVSTKQLDLIVAVDKNNGIGRDGVIPWKCKDDLLRFKRKTVLTSNPENVNAVVYGRRTYESLKGRCLLNRLNVVISCTKQEGDVLTFPSLNEAVEALDTMTHVEKVFICGGVHIYREALEKMNVTRVHLTRIRKDYKCDRFVDFLPEYLRFYNMTIVRETTDFGFYIYVPKRVI